MVRLNNTWIFLLPVLFLAIVGCDKDGGVESNPSEPIVLTTEQEAMVESGNAFALDLLSLINKEKDGNYVFSPLSLQFILGMLLNGASDDAADEICRVLGYGAGETASVNEYCGRLIRELPKRDKQTQVATARLALSGLHTPFLPTYQNAIRSDYSAMCESVDFDKSAAVRDKVNKWSSENTNGLIRDFISKEEVSAMKGLAAVLLDATWFKGRWTCPFNKKNTEKGPFHREDGATSQVEYMKMTTRTMVKGVEGYTVLHLFYGNQSFSMVFVLPDEGWSVEKTLDNLTVSDVIQKGCLLKKSEIWIPSFKMDNTIDYDSILREMGIRKAFSGGGLSSMLEGNVALGRVKQKTALRVDESGAEAASVTEANVMFTAAIEPDETLLVFHADRPFLFFIEENSTGVILFAGCYRGM